MKRRNTTDWLVVVVASAAILTTAPTKAGAEIISSKRGLADNSTTYDELQASGASWYYTWGSNTVNIGNFDANQIPMFWNAPSPTTINNVKSRNTAYILGFNEPERTDQANMSVTQALSSWSTISNSFAGTSTKLISPAVADTVDYVNSQGQTVIGGRTWLANFMSELNNRKTNSLNPGYNPNLRVDAIAFHWYGVKTPNNPAGAAASFLGSVDMYHNTYGLPIFITEFAIHDWDNVYTDAEIIDANRQFLDIVVPALESRSYVSGYSWFKDFTDSHLYAGSPSTPTPMAYSYVGAVGAGQIANIAGQNLGEHVAYLSGGELTMSGGSPGTLHYINALAGVSSISGGMDWSLSGQNWLRIQSDATLRKSGPNQITFSGGTITNNGTLEVGQGSLRVAAPVSGSGGVRVTGGTLALVGTGNFNLAPLIDVQSGGTFDVSGVNGVYNVAARQTLNNRRSGLVVGNVFATAGSTVAGGGTFAGNLTAQDSSKVRVGEDGTGVPTRYIIDNFESYALGDVRTTASPPWTAHQDTPQADIENIGGNKALSFGWAGGSTDFRGVSRPLPEIAVIDNSTTATFFFRINSKTDVPNHSVGLGDRATTTTVDFGDFETQLRIKQGTSAGTYAIDARSGGSFTSTLASGLALNSWYNIWMVVNQANDKYDLYMNTGTAAATAANKLNPSPLSFRNGTTSDLNTFLALAGSAPIDNGVRIDDLVFLTGLDLTNPAAGFDPGFIWTPEVLTINEDYSQSSTAILQINLRDPAHNDVLRVIGNATLGGTLDVSFAAGAPAPHAGDTFKILDFVTASGEFDSMLLPMLPAGLAWNTSSLLTTGNLKVQIVGDYNGDGTVDAADYTVWRDTLHQSGDGLGADGNGDGTIDEMDYAVWRTHFGETAGTGAVAIASPAVPEPASALMLLTAVVVTCFRYRDVTSSTQRTVVR